MGLVLAHKRRLAILAHLEILLQLNCLIVQILVGDSFLVIEDLISIDRV